MKGTAIAIAIMVMGFACVCLAASYCQYVTNGRTCGEMLVKCNGCGATGCASMLGCPNTVYSSTPYLCKYCGRGLGMKPIR